ncbi:PQQ-dependent sugar dehydrogenase [Cellulomonas sp.]|uniref:PQQ-dependent sugar dehydrogenase n=1 Tax=Cellulomonas sp. TaxID=40001 RepID=UPI001B110866|nr:PQQ-dependent sugar dehydrogenase [Cellulomonas sp.]MBO9553565.1 PQQ-dependent sugar dehydrogenase [Cellulomonas sp.]
MTVVPEPVWSRLTFPTSLAFDDDGVAFVAESGLPFGGAAPGGRVWAGRLDDDRRRLVVDGLPAPVNGLTSDEGTLLVSVPGAVLRLTLDGEVTTVVDGLPAGGNYHTNMVAVGPDGWLYLGQGAMTNSAVVGLDGIDLGWLRNHDHPADVPGYDVVLDDVAVETPDPLGAPGATATTGAFAPFGTRLPPGSVLRGRVPCTAAVLRCRRDGSGLELVAWGTRNPYGLAFLPDGRLLAVDQGADDRGSRPIGDAPDVLFEIRPGAWYGWPDYVDGVPVTDPSLTPVRGEKPTFVLADHTALPPPERGLVRFPPHTAATKLAVGPVGDPRWQGTVLVTLFGDERPMTAPEGPRVGRSVTSVDTRTWAMTPLVTGPLLRPIDVAFSPVDGTPYVVDFGRFEMGPAGGVEAVASSGGVWRLRIEERDRR